MKIGKLKFGMLVAVNSCDNGQVYKVESVQDNGKCATLSYVDKTRGRVSGGYVDVSLLKTPTKKQLEGCLESFLMGKMVKEKFDKNEFPML